VKSAREKYLRNEATKQVERYLRKGRHPNGGRNRHPRNARKHTSRTKPGKHTRSRIRMRSHGGRS
jgi:hypothetical protein